MPLIRLKNNDMKIFDNKTLVAKILLTVYCIFFLYSIVWELTSLINMLLNTVLPYDSLWSMVIAMVLVAIYGGLKGVETVGRSGFVILFIAVSGMILMAIGVFPLINDTGSRIFFYDGYSDTVNNTINIFTRSTFLPQMVMLSSYVKKEKMARNLIIGQVACGLLIAGIFLITQLSLGEYAKIQQFPIYTLTSAIVMEPLKRMDVIFTVIWIMIAILKVTVTFLAIGKCIGETKDVNSKKIIIPVCGLIVTLVTVYLVNNEVARANILSLNLYFLLSIILGAIIPTAVLAINKPIKTKEKKI